MKHYGKLTAAAAAGFMALSAMGVVPVFAADGDTVEVTKTVTKTDANALVPEVTFEYSITNGAAVGEIYAGVNDGLLFVNDDATLETNNDAIGSKTATYSGASLNAPVAAYTAPGVYHYVVNETTNYTDDYDGLATTNDEINVYVHVINGANGLEIGAITASKDSVTKAPVDFAADYTTYTLAVTKQVTGNQGDKERDFNFKGNVSVSGTHDRITSQKNTGSAVAAEEKTNIATTLTDGDSFTIHGLSAKDVAAITEDNYADEGYTTTIKKEEDTVDAASKAATDAENLAYIVVNDKNVTTPTGILLTAAPYAAIVGLGGIFAGLFFRRKRED